MKRSIITVIAFLMAATAVWGQLPTRTANIPVQITSDGSNSYREGIAYAEGNVIVRYGEDIIYADQVTFDQEKREVSARGNVRIYAENMIYRGEFLTYQLDSNKVQSEDFRSAMERIYAFSEDVETPEEGYYVFKNAGLTTENRENPSYSLRASTMEIYLDDRAVFKNVGVYLGSVPIFWVPYVAIPLDGETDAFDFTTGSYTRWGYFAIGSYTTALDSRWTVTAHGSYRLKRGGGGGIDFEFNPRPGEHAEFQSFVTHDFDTENLAGTAERPFEPENARYRFEYKHRFQPADDIYTMADINVWSDKFITEDFFPKVFKEEREASNLFEVLYYDTDFTASILADIQVNNMFNVTEREPEFAFEFKRQKMFNTPITYEGGFGFVNFNQQFDEEFRKLNPGNNAYEAIRYDMWHQFLYPRQYFNWLNVTPFVGARGTAYSRDNVGASPNADKYRYAFTGGMDVSFKLSKTWRDVQNPDMGIDGLRHLAEPFATLSYTPKPNETSRDIRGFDNRVPSTRLQPLTWGAYNSVDSINKLGAVRHGIRNKLQTKRDGRTVDLIDWVVYAQANFDRPSGTSATGASSFSDAGLLTDDLYSHIFNELTINPFPWLEVELYAAQSLVDETFDEYSLTIDWQVAAALEIELGFRYLENLNTIPGLSFTESSLLSLSAFWRLNENWQLRPYASFEGDDSVVEEAGVTLYRDFRAWKASFTTAY
ncbi:MAG: LPS assembly protein LptD, partial [Verrucomicrobiota bacterium]